MKNVNETQCKITKSLKSFFLIKEMKQASEQRKKIIQNVYELLTSQS